MKNVIAIIILGFVSHLIAQSNQAWEIVLETEIPDKTTEIFWQSKNISKAPSPVSYRKEDGHGGREGTFSITGGATVQLPGADTSHGVYSSFNSDTKSILTSFKQDSKRSIVDAYEVRDLTGKFVGRHERIPSDFVLLSTGMADGRIFGYTEETNSFVMLLPNTETLKIILKDERIIGVQHFEDKWYHLRQNYNPILSEYSITVGVKTENGFASLFLVIDSENNVIIQLIKPTINIPTYFMTSAQNKYFAVFTPIEKITTGKMEIYSRAGNKVSEKDAVDIGLGESFIITDNGRIITALSEKRIAIYDIESMDEVRRYIVPRGKKLKAIAYSRNTDMIYTVMYGKDNYSRNHMLAIYDMKTVEREPVTMDILNVIQREQENTVQLFISGDGTNICVRSGNKVLTLDNFGD